LPNLLLIGAANRDAGKTTFACGVINTLRQALPATGIIGVKVTAIREVNGECPRGGSGCGVCSTLEGDYCITEETCLDSAKDTSRLLAAGAERVFWLQVLHEQMAAGLLALLELVPPGAPLVCESNSLSRVVKPGLFLMLERQGGLQIKATAREALPRADRRIAFNGRSFQIAPERLRFAEGVWRLETERHPLQPQPDKPVAVKAGEERA